VRVTSRGCRGGWRHRLGRGRGGVGASHVVPVEDVADGSSVDAEPGTQFVGCRTSRIVLDQRLSLVGVELPCPPWFRPFGGRWGWCGGVG
jgi:hypothetical protein